MKLHPVSSAGNGPLGRRGRNDPVKDSSDASTRPFDRNLIAGAFAALALLGTQAALAGAACSVSTAGVSFGAYDISLMAPNDSIGNITITCTHVAPGAATGVNYQASLSTGVSGSYTPRQMASGAARLNYNLFSDAARSSIWGNGLGGTSIATGELRVGPGVGNGTRTAELPLYGRVPAQQSVPMGPYSDTIVVTLTF